MDYIIGGEILSKEFWKNYKKDIKENKNELQKLEENEVKVFFKQIVKGLDYCKC